MAPASLKGLAIPSSAYRRVGGYRKGERIARYLHGKRVSPQEAWAMKPAEREAAAKKAGQNPASDDESWGAVCILLAELSQ